MNPQTLERVAVALHGPQWKRGLARDLGVSERLLGYYMRDGERTIPADMAARLAPLVAAKLKSLSVIGAMLAREIMAA